MPPREPTARPASNSAINTAMIAITTSSSIRVKPREADKETARFLMAKHLSEGGLRDPHNDDKRIEERRTPMDLLESQIYKNTMGAVKAPPLHWHPQGIKSGRKDTELNQNEKQETVTRI